MAKMKHWTAEPLFLSTPSARRATTSSDRGMASTSYFYPRPPRGGRQPCAVHLRCMRQISIHALREEGDCITHNASKTVGDFYPRPPRGGRHVQEQLRAMLALISIHALREEGDGTNQAICQLGYQFLSTPSARRATVGGFYFFVVRHHFYPRPPRGGRPGRR